MNSKLIGGTLLMIGTSIGAGMLALPIATAAGGFVPASFFLIGAWAVMTLGAFLILEVNLRLPEGSNIISMAQWTLGRWGQVAAWITYLLLLYSLLAAYIASGSNVLTALTQHFHFDIPNWIDALIVVGVLGAIVWRGTYCVDIANRFFISTKFIAYFGLVIALAPFIKLANFDINQPHLLLSAVTVMITSFGFATILPSIRTYFNSDVKKLRIAVLVGSFVPLLLYIAWIATVEGSLPSYGPDGLIQMATSGQSTPELTERLSNYLNSDWVASFAHLFIYIAVATSFLGVSLSLSDFLADGLKIKKQGRGNLWVYSATFIPPLAIVFINPGIFIKSLSFAGILCAILLMLLPALMAWSSRYYKKSDGYRVFGGKTILLLEIIAAFVVIILGLMYR